MPFVLFVIKCLYFMLPAYLANIAPVIFKRFNLLKYPVDFGAKLRGRPVFGKNKTLGGLVLAVIVALAVFYIQIGIYSSDTIKAISFFDYTTATVWIGILLGVGAILGDMVESFFKRQLDLAPGKPWIPFDQLDFVLGALVLVSFVYTLTLEAYIVIIIISPLVHIIANHIGFWFKVRDEKW